MIVTFPFVVLSLSLLSPVLLPFYHSHSLTPFLSFLPAYSSQNPAHSYSPSTNIITYTTYRGHGESYGWTGKSSILSEMGTIQMELAKLSQHTGDLKYHNLGHTVFEKLYRQTKPISGLYPSWIDPRSGRFSNSLVGFGAYSDSFYEYELKMWIMTGKKVDLYRNMYLESIDAMKQHLWRYSRKGNYAYIGEKSGNREPTNVMEHLVCFVPGMLALGVHHKVVEGKKAEEHLTMAKELARTCVDMYLALGNTGLAPDSARFDQQGMHIAQRHFRLRPETVESLFYLYRITKEEQYREWAWRLFESMDSHLKTAYGHANIRDVSNKNSLADRMESFWIAETLKYLYLTFDTDDVIDIDQYVFNTEAHPLRIIPDWDQKLRNMK